MWLISIILRGMWLLGLKVAEYATDIRKLCLRAPLAEEGIPPYPEYGLWPVGWKGICHPA